MSILGIEEIFLAVKYIKKSIEYFNGIFVVQNYTSYHSSISQYLQHLKTWWTVTQNLFSLTQITMPANANIKGDKHREVWVLNEPRLN